MATTSFAGLADDITFRELAGDKQGAGGIAYLSIAPLRNEITLGCFTFHTSMSLPF
jgi:hypothetical protein